MPSLRFKLGTLMIAVLLMGGVLGWGVEMARRSESYRRRAAWHAQQAQENDHEVTASFGRIWVPSTPEDYMRYERPIFERADYYRMMKDKYEHLADYPWLWVDRDPPAPELR
jgi:hypothetical protein